MGGEKAIQNGHLGFIWGASGPAVYGQDVGHSMELSEAQLALYGWNKGYLICALHGLHLVPMLTSSIWAEYGSFNMGITWG